MARKLSFFLPVVLTATLSLSNRKVLGQDTSSNVMTRDNVSGKKLNDSLAPPMWKFEDSPLDKIIQQIADAHGCQVNFVYRPTTKVHFIYPLKAGIEDVLAKLTLLGVNFKLTFTVVNKGQNTVHVEKIITVKKGYKWPTLFFYSPANP
jgi:hypothetical protein